MANQLSKFISGFADKTALLHVLSKALGSRLWQIPQNEPLKKLKHAHRSTYFQTLIHYDPNFVKCKLNLHLLG